nr:MAG TPA: hypothetical protein [Caudoviricetes sp.]
MLPYCLMYLVLRITVTRLLWICSLAVLVM